MNPQTSFLEIHPKEIIMDTKKDLSIGAFIFYKII